MNNFLPGTLCAAVCLASSAGAMELSDLTPALTRTEADTNLTKDYKYRVLSDLSVRRIWELDENRKLTIDFNPQKDSVICMMLDYKKPVSVEEGTKAILDITKAPEAKWSKLPTDKAAKYGVEHAHALKVDGGYAFMECNTAGKCIRVTLFREVPKSSRRLLQDIAAVASVGKDAGTGKLLLEEEATRFSTPNKTDLAKNITESDTMEDDEPIAAAETEPEEVKKAEPVTAVATTAEPDKHKKKTKKQHHADSNKHQIAEKTWFEQLTPTEWGIGGGAIVIIFTLIGIVRRSNEQKRLKARAAAMAARDLHSALRPAVPKTRIRR